jgi:hypothetical protein
MPNISDNIWLSCIKYSPCFTMEIRALNIYNSKRQGTCSGKMYWLHRPMDELSHCFKNKRYVCIPLLFSLRVRYCLWQIVTEEKSKLPWLLYIIFCYIIIERNSFFYFYILVYCDIVTYMNLTLFAFVVYRLWQIDIAINLEYVWLLCISFVINCYWRCLKVVWLLYILSVANWYWNKP